MHHRVTRESRVVSLDVQFELSHEIVLAEKVQTGSRVRVILMRRRFARLWLNKEVACEAYLLLVVHRHAQECREVIQFTAHVRIIESGIALTTAPEDVAFATKAMSDFESLLYLGCPVGKTVS